MIDSESIKTFRAFVMLALSTRLLHISRTMYRIQCTASMGGIVWFVNLGLSACVVLGVDCPHTTGLKISKKRYMRSCVILGQDYYIYHGLCTQYSVLLLWEVFCGLSTWACQLASCSG